jgi:hypothetical protein
VEKQTQKNDDKEEEEEGTEKNAKMGWEESNRKL